MFQESYQSLWFFEVLHDILAIIIASFVQVEYLQKNLLQMVVWCWLSQPFHVGKIMGNIMIDE